MITFSSYDSIRSINKNNWDCLTENDLFLKYDFLALIEDLLENHDFSYLLAYQNKQCIGIAYIQYINLKHTHLKNQLKFISLIPFKYTLAVLGNIFFTGNNGFLAKENINQTVFLNELTDYLQRKNKHKFSFILLKDLKFNPLLKLNFFKVASNPAMYLEISEKWKTFNDYMICLKSKFRIKAKSTYKKSTDLQITNLSLDEITTQIKQLDLLYKNVAMRSNFNLILLPTRFLIELKRTLKNTFNVIGYYHENKLVGFSSFFIQKKQLNAFYVGLNYTINKNYALYQRMVYDLIQYAINNKYKTIELGRTAEYFKSSVGALPKSLPLYLKHTNTLQNLIWKLVETSRTKKETHQLEVFKKKF